MDSMSVRDVRALLSGLVSSPDIPLPHLEADRIICGALGVSRASLHARPGMEIPPEECAGIIDMGRRRASGEPLAYILGTAIFCGRQFLVDRSVLIPRTETEILTEIAGNYLKTIRGGVFADWCTGSGCVAIALLEDNPNFEAFAVDSSPDALRVAERNAKFRGVSERIKFIQCREPGLARGAIPPGSLDMIVSNPPYIPTAEIENLELQVRGYEPRVAIDGGADGNRVYRSLLTELPFFMRENSPLLFETGGGGQPEEIKRIAESAVGAKLEFRETTSDHRGVFRFMQWRKIE
jgi:release factor glutamine methyltransferase